MGAIIDLGLTACFFVFISRILSEHVFFVDEPALSIATYMASACLSGVFWLAIVCFRVTYRDYKRFRNDE
ncbi:MAG: hypothetical protein B7X06_04080 [Verrucomicrobia bacterium 21-51-4]|nr:MAG: hypothetical protein B7X06_04080 [Verrucomicrobia bacterium 21-51-4]